MSVRVMADNVRRLSASEKVRVGSDGKSHRWHVLGIIVVIFFVLGLLYGRAIELEKLTVYTLNARPMDLSAAEELELVLSPHQMATRYRFLLVGEKPADFDPARFSRKNPGAVVYITTYDRPLQKLYIFCDSLPQEGDFGLKYRRPLPQALRGGGFSFNRLTLY